MIIASPVLCYSPLPNLSILIKAMLKLIPFHFWFITVQQHFPLPGQLASLHYWGKELRRHQNSRHVLTSDIGGQRVAQIWEYENTDPKKSSEHINIVHQWVKFKRLKYKTGHPKTIEDAMKGGLTAIYGPVMSRPWYRRRVRTWPNETLYRLWNVGAAIQYNTVWKKIWFS